MTMESPEQKPRAKGSIKRKAPTRGLSALAKRVDAMEQNLKDMKASMDDLLEFKGAIVHLGESVKKRVVQWGGIILTAVVASNIVGGKAGAFLAAVIEAFKQ